MKCRCYVEYIITMQIKTKVQIFTWIFSVMHAKQLNPEATRAKVSSDILKKQSENSKELGNGKAEDTRNLEVGTFLAFQSIETIVY